MVEEAVIAFVANDDMVFHGNVQEFAGSHEFLGQFAVVGAGPRVARRVVVAHDDAGGIEFQRVLEDDFRIGDDMGGSAVANTLYVQWMVALVEVEYEEVFLVFVFDFLKETFVRIIGVLDFIGLFGVGGATAFAQFKCRHDGTDNQS